MNVMEAIRTRRSIGRMKQDPVDRAIIEQLLEAATWAPSHHNTQPWRFFVMTGEGRDRLGQGYANVAAAGFPENMEDAVREERIAKEFAKARRSPVVIAIACVLSDDQRAVPSEELAAANAAAQNMLLAAHGAGLAAIWRSGAPMMHPLMKETFGLRDVDQLVGFVYVGYADATANEGLRTPFAEKMVWWDE